MVLTMSILLEREKESCVHRSMNSADICLSLAHEIDSITGGGGGAVTVDD